MKFFRKKTMKSGYCNISEPVSDLDPARISEIKARHSKLKQKQSHKPSPSNDDTLLSENITLDTSPSQMASMSTGTSSKSSEKKVLPDLQEPSGAETEVESAPLPPLATESDAAGKVDSPSSRNLKHAPKTPDTFFGGKNKKRISIKMDTASQAPTEPPISATPADDGEAKEEGEDAKVMPEPNTTETNNRKTSSNTEQVDGQSQSSDLDKTFSPQIVSVNSDITDPSYGISTSRRKKVSQQPSWRKFKKLRRYLHESMNSKSTCNSRQRNQNPLSFLETIIDTVCTYPGGKPNS